MKNKIIQIVAVLVIASPVYGGLMEKAKLLDSILADVDYESLVQAFDETTQIGSALEYISRYPEEQGIKVYANAILQENLGEIVIRNFEVYELEILDEMSRKGGKQRKFALRILCMSMGNNNEISQKLRALTTYPPPAPSYVPPPPVNIIR